jgi:C4-type Zn-finger protein
MQNISLVVKARGEKMTKNCPNCGSDLRRITDTTLVEKVILLTECRSCGWNHMEVLE